MIEVVIGRHGGDDACRHVSFVEFSMSSVRQGGSMMP